jgi:16S rRNA (guanine527-N7)-methyltransferase
MPETATPVEEFARALDTHAARYGLQLSADATTTLRDYYEMVQAWNARLHLVAPCSPAEFATRHVLESLLAIRHLPDNARIADIGSGAGLPIIPCLIARPDIRATLIESSPKKAVFLREALRATGTSERTQVVAERFEKTPTPDAGIITCRALDRFIASFSNILAWSPHVSRLLLFGGPTLQAELEKARLSYDAFQIPNSEQRFLFVIEMPTEI